MAHPQHDFGWLLRDVQLAFRRRDCDDARIITSKLLLKARTPKQRETVFRLQNAVRQCARKHDGLGRARRSLAGGSVDRLQKGRREALLAKPVIFQGRQMTKAQMIDEMARQGGTLKLDRLPKYVFSSRAYNKMDYAAQRAYDEKMKTKMPFAIQLPSGTFFEVTATEAEYFKSVGGQLGRALRKKGR